jgi:deoxyribodipyrimidine photo-lyase
MRKQSKFLTFVLLFCFSMTGTMGLSTHRANQAAQKGGVVFHWFRLGDLRLHDNPALDRSAKICEQTQSSLIPVFCFDPRIFGDNARSEFGSLKCGPRRAKFVLESVADLRQSLERKGSKLVVAYAKPEDVFSQLLQDCKNTRSKIVYQDEVCSEERTVEHKVKKLFQSSEAVWGSTMYDLKDLPYDVDNNLSDMPDTFTPFRNKVEKNCQIRAPLPTPKQLSSFPLDTLPALGPYASFLPTLKDLCYTQDQIQSAATSDPRGVMEFKGGETAALARVKDYIWDKDLLHKYFDTRNGMIGADYSTKFSPWLAHGNLSPR